MSEDAEIELNGRKIDLNKALPLKLGDWKRLEKQGVTPASLSEGKISDSVAIIFYVLHKADETVTEEEVEDLTMTDPVVLKTVGLLQASEENVDRPL